MQHAHPLPRARCSFFQICGDVFISSNNAPINLRLRVADWEGVHPYLPASSNPPQAHRAQL